MAVTYAETLTTGRQLWSNDEQTIPSVWGWYEQHMIAWMGDLCNPQLGAITAGSGYQDGTYQNVELRRKDYALNTGGKHMLATVTVVGGGVSTVAITRKGNGFKTGDTLVIYNLAEVGGTGSGYEQIVDSADASIGFILDTQQATYPTYTVGMKIGMDRDDSYNMGSMWFKRVQIPARLMFMNAIRLQKALLIMATAVGSTRPTKASLPGMRRMATAIDFRFFIAASQITHSLFGQIALTVR